MALGNKLFSTFGDRGASVLFMTKALVQLSGILLNNQVALKVEAFGNKT